MHGMEPEDRKEKRRNERMFTFFYFSKIETLFCGFSP
jgi:hypothetical protein